MLGYGGIDVRNFHGHFCIVDAIGTLRSVATLACVIERGNFAASRNTRACRAPPFRFGSSKKRCPISPGRGEESFFLNSTSLVRSLVCCALVFVAVRCRFFLGSPGKI